MSRASSISFALALTAAGLAGCNDNTNSPGPDGGDGSGSGGGGGGGGGGDIHGPGQPDPAGIAVVNSDFTSSTISLLSADTGQVVKPDCITSGTHAPGATLALSGDVVLPSWTQANSYVIAIDRSNSALTWINPVTCGVVRQFDVSTGFRANPHDVVSISPTKAYVLRYELNKASKTNRDGGDDILIIDPTRPAITGRIPLGSFAVQGTGPTIQARPDRARLIDGKVYVALSNLSGDFFTATHGRILVIDPATDQVTTTIDLAGFKNCSGLSYVESTKTLAVECTGAFSDASPPAGSGVIYLDLGASPPAETHRTAVAPFGGRALASFSGVARDGALGFAVTAGEFMSTPTDQLWTFDTTAGTATKIADGSDSFIYGNVLVDPAHERAYLTDAASAAPRIQIYSYAGTGAPTLSPPVNASPGVGLPPRELSWY